MKKVSIIIPVYNAELYIHKCLDSVCSQTYRNLEIICVDDGSVDLTNDILKQYAKKDSRIKLITQKNKGESGARNTGLSLCTGDYIAFIDCDDWIDVHMYQEMVEAMEANDVDIVACSYVREENEISKVMVNEIEIPQKVIGGEDFLRYVYHRDCYRGVSGFIWCKLYKRDLLIENNKVKYSFDENTHFGGDVFFFSQVILDVKRAYYLPKAFYHYLQRADSTMHTENLDIWMEFLKTYQLVIMNFQQKHINIEIINLVSRFLAYWASNVALKAIQQKNNSILNKCKKIMQENEKIYYSTNKDFPDRLKRYYEIMNAEEN